MLTRMIRRRARRGSLSGEDEGGKLDLTPMIDAVFLLLIFFMCSMEFRAPDALIKAFLPKDRGPNQQSPDEIRPDVRIKLLWIDPTTLRPTADPDAGEVVLKVGSHIYADAEGRPDYEALYRELVKLRETARRGPTAESLPAIIDARGQVPYQHVVSALNACVKAKLTEVSFAAPEKPF